MQEIFSNYYYKNGTYVPVYQLIFEIFLIEYIAVQYFGHIKDEFFMKKTPIPSFIPMESVSDFSS